MVITYRASTEHPEMPQVVLLLKMPCDSTSRTATQVDNPLRSPSHEQDPRKHNAPMSRVLRAVPPMLNERSKILTSTDKPTTDKADPPDRGPTTPRRGPYFPCLYSDDSCGFQWRDVYAVTPQFFWTCIGEEGGKRWGGKNNGESGIALSLCKRFCPPVRLR